MSEAHTTSIQSKVIRLKKKVVCFLFRCMSFQRPLTHVLSSKVNLLHLPGAELTSLLRYLVISSEEMHFVSQDTLHPCVFCSFSMLEECSYMHRWVAAVCRPPWKILLHLLQRGAWLLLFFLYTFLHIEREMLIMSYVWLWLSFN